MRHTNPKPEAITLDVNGKKITAIRHRQQDTQCNTRLLCLHGWLDNANSFVPMMPYLPEIDLVAIDLPGHGYSSHIDSGYSVVEMMYWVTLVADALDWSDYHLMGHSLGGCIAPLVAAATPDKVQSMIIIEASGALSEEADKLPDRLRRSLADRLQPEKFQSRVYENKQAAVDTRLRVARMNPAAARLIIDRQVDQTDDGVSWRFDPRLRMASPYYLTEMQVQRILEDVQCPTLTVVATDGFLSGRPTTEVRLSCLKNRENVTLAGHHHLHMDNPEPVAAAINRFLGTKPALGG